MALQIHTAGHDGLGIRPEHLHLIMGTADRLMQPGLRRGTGGLGVVGVGELPCEGTIGAVRVERHRL